MSFTRACGIGEVPPGRSLATELDSPTGVAVAVVHTVDDEWYAIDDECSHAEVPLSEGEVEGCEIECWMHGSRFDLRTGKPTGPPATAPVPIYPVTVEGDDVLVDLTTTLND